MKICTWPKNINSLYKILLSIENESKISLTWFHINDFKIFCSKNTDSIVDIFGHDWLIYCFSRENGYSWGALDIIGVNYRQHSNNSMGANAGRNLFKRVKLVYHGWYQDQVVRIVRVVAPEKEILLANPMLRIINFWNFRRRFRDKLILLFFFITGMY